MEVEVARLRAALERAEARADTYYMQLREHGIVPMDPAAATQTELDRSYFFLGMEPASKRPVTQAELDARLAALKTSTARRTMVEVEAEEEDAWPEL